MLKPSKRHPHKGPESRRKALRSVPFVDMSKDEMQAVFADIAEWKERLHAYRTGERLDPYFDERLQLAVIWLIRPGRPKIMVGWDVENGDGQGILFVLEQFEQIKISNALLPGESVAWELVEPADLVNVELNAEQRAAIESRG